MEVMVRELEQAPCPIVRFNALVGGKYKIRLLWEMRAGPKRYGALARALALATGGRAVTPRILSRELRELTAAELIVRKQYPVIPPRVEYRLTDGGRKLLGVMRAICRWGS